MQPKAFAEKSIATIYFAITDHGFGHAARTAAIAETIRQNIPELKIIVATTAPEWLIAAYIRGDFVYRRRSFDVGVVQIDSLQMDLPATRERWQSIFDTETETIATEAAFLRENKVDLVFADIPPLAVKIASAAGIPCWAASNFAWDFIYRDWGGEYAKLADRLSTYYSECDRLFRLPFSESLDRFPHREDVGLTGGNPRYSQDELWQSFGWQDNRDRTILLTFGGLNLAAIPYETLSQFPDDRFITFDRDAPDNLPNLVKIIDRSYRPVDFMPYCDLVVSKPGYTTYAEATIVGTPVATLTRSGFAESAIILNAMCDCHSHQIVDNSAFFAGNWDFLREVPQPPRRSAIVAKDGNSTISRSVREYFAKLIDI
jgi:UDP:flavonoid glycosyltransferase YjiC (YdhE family)